MNTHKRFWILLVLGGMGAWWVGSALYIHAKAWLAQQLIAAAWDRTLAGTERVRPWPWADTWPITRLRSPTAAVDLYILADAAGRSLAFGPGHVSGTSPLGTFGNAMIAGHRDTHFKFLRDLHAGAELLVQTADGAEYRYEVTESLIFDVRTERLHIAPTHPTLTLLTCYPFDAIRAGGPLRYAAVATLL